MWTKVRNVMRTCKYCENICLKISRAVAVKKLWKLQTSSCSSAQISSSIKKATLVIYSCISMKKPLLEVGKLEGMLVKSCWWLSRDSIGPWIRKFFTSLHRLQIQSRWNRWWHRNHWLLNSSNSELPWPPRCRAEKLVFKPFRCRRIAKITEVFTR